MPRILLVPKWVLPFGYGLTLWHWLLVRKDSINLNYVIEHEKAHWRQWQIEGSYLIWAIKWMGYTIKYGYEENPYEVEARLMGVANSNLTVDKEEVIHNG